ncbi:MAG: aminotransferase class V-fold PLP-dependent enzyme [Firmicutes bacterium]|nr:aminotransferase class V-fold PLP-dependent enzyme [Bacillota bacterium]
MIFFNNAATTQQKPEGVKGAAPKTEGEVRPLIAELFGMKHPENIAFTQSGTQAVALALRTFLKEGDHVITTVTEQDATIAVLEDMGVTYDLLGIDVYGTLNCDALEELIKEDTKAIVCAHGCSVTGNIADLETVCNIARRHKLPVISDGCQTAGAAEVNLVNLGVDVYCFTSHKKLMGPYGIGGICFADEKLKKTFDEVNKEIIGEIDEKKLGGLFVSVGFILEKGIYGVSMWPHRLAKRFFESSQSLDKVKVYGNFGTNTRIPTIAFSVEGHTPEEVKEYLRKEYGIVTKAGHHGSRLMHEALGTADTGLVRLSIGYYNNRFQVNDAVWALMKLTDQMDFYLLS